MFGIYLSNNNESRRISEFKDTKTEAYQDMRTRYERLKKSFVVSPLGEHSFAYVNKEGEIELVEISHR